MAWGRMNAIVVMIIALLCLLSLCPITRAQPKTYIVGDEEGWSGTIDMESWPRGKTFYAGDVLEFHYDYQMYNVAVVNQRGHDTCTVSAGAQVFDSGDDRIQLKFGANYFICSTFSDLCAAGMKMAINATARPHQ